MLTIKHIEKSGHQNVSLAATVSFDPAVGERNEFPNGQVVACGVISVEDGKIEYSRYGTGIVYVMNNHGATVAKYDLD